MTHPDPGFRRRYGLYATPPALVRYVVRSVHLLAQSRLGWAQGLADPRARILDPAAGALRFFFSALREAPASSGSQGHCFIALELLDEPFARGQRALRRLQADLPIRYLQADALRESTIKSLGPCSIVVGNPPWRGSSASRNPWISELLRGYRRPDGSWEEGYFRVDGRPLGERNPKWLQDDCVKFLRVAQWLIDCKGEGIAGYVLNHNLIDAPTFRGLRCSLLRTFDELYILDLHGNRRKKERGPDGLDENVFAGVAQGAAVVLLVKGPGLRKGVFHAGLYGARRAKLRILAEADVTTTPWRRLAPQSPSYLFASTDRQVDRLFARGLPLPQIFPLHGCGIITGNDRHLTALDPADFGRGIDLERLTSYLARPFDHRHLLFYCDRMARPRSALMAHLCAGNLGLIVSRQSKEEPAALVTRSPAGHKVVTAYDISSLFPLFLRPLSDRTPNLAPLLPRKLAEAYGQIPSPETILAYTYAILYAPPYRSRYRALLRREFPRIPFPRSSPGFQALAAAGEQLIRLHLLEDPTLLQAPLCLHGDPAASIDRRALCYRETEHLLILNRQGLALGQIPPEVWGYQLGAYPVLRQWLAARSGRKLRYPELRELHAIAQALQKSAVLEAAIAPLYEETERNHLNLLDQG